MKLTLPSTFALIGLTLPGFANDSMATADDMLPNDYYSNYAINPAGDNDFIRIVFPSSGSFVASTEGTLDTYGYLLNSSGNVIAEDDDSGDSTNCSITRNVTPGTYYFRVRAYSAAATGSFQVRTVFTPAVDDHGNDIGTATPVTLSGTAASSRAGAIEDAGDVDVFRVAISGNGFLNARTTGPSDTVGDILNSSGVILSSNDDATDAHNFSLRQAVTAGTYYVKVRNYGTTTGPYTLVVQFEGTTTTPPSTNLRALVIGISNYKNINDLEYCDDDARSVRDLLTNSGWTVSTLIDSQATKGAIHAKINALAPGGGKFLLYYSGHGSSSGTTGYICNWDTTGGKASMISETELNTWLNKAGTTQVGVVLDSCFSGAFIGKSATPVSGQSRYFKMTDGAAPDPRAGEFLARNISNSKRVVIAGCKSTQLSWELGSINHGWMTYNLLQAWNNQDYDKNSNNWVSLEEGFTKVAKGTTIGGQKQTPQIHDGNGAAQFSVRKF